MQMKRQMGVFALAAGMAAGALRAEEATEMKDRRTAWFREAKFGMFIHWGLYAVPAGEWKGKPVAGIGEWIINRAKIPVADYAKLASQFNPVKFNAEEWVLAVNGESIHGAGPSAFGQEFGHKTGLHVETRGRDVPAYEGVMDWRCTTKPNRLYIHLLKRPGESFELNGVKGSVQSAYLLADRERKPLSVTQNNGKLTVRLPSRDPGNLSPCSVWKQADRRSESLPAKCRFCRSLGGAFPGRRH